MVNNIIQAAFAGGRTARTRPLTQYDYGQILVFIGLNLPDVYEVHFANAGGGAATTSIGGPDGVVIPDIYLTSGADITAWLYLHTGESDGETVYTVTIPVTKRASISDAPPTPVQQDAITQAIAALNAAVEQTGEDVSAAAASASAAAGSESAAGAAQTAAEAARDRAETAAVNAARDAADAATSASAASGSAANASTSATAANASASRAEQAAARSGWMEIEINGNGHLIYTRIGNAGFDLELSNGHLYMVEG